MISTQEMLEWANDWFKDQLAEGGKLKEKFTREEVLFLIVTYFENQRVEYANETANNTRQTFEFAFEDWGIDYVDGLEEEDYFDFQAVDETLTESAEQSDVSATPALDNAPKKQ